ncbi:MAG: hypothetical protein KDI66_10670 [Xanthomonadales bacterium]|nr:hypothetical protein [Xanthomonadales bacterium]
MSALHHVSVGPTAREHWAQLELALGEGDVLVLLDGATADLAAIAAWKRSLALELRCVIPQIALLAGLAVPPAIEVIDDRHWWRLIASHEILLEWN